MKHITLPIMSFILLECWWPVLKEYNSIYENPNNYVIGSEITLFYELILQKHLF